MTLAPLATGINSYIFCHTNCNWCVQKFHFHWHEIVYTVLYIVCTKSLYIQYYHNDKLRLGAYLISAVRRRNTRREKKCKIYLKITQNCLYLYIVVAQALYIQKIIIKKNFLQQNKQHKCALSATHEQLLYACACVWCMCVFILRIHAH